jgi:hypothetical protein
MKDLRFVLRLCWDSIFSNSRDIEDYACGCEIMLKICWSQIGLSIFLIILTIILMITKII